MSMRDKEFHNMTISVSKALNPIEAPLKVKHARAVIIGTHKSHGAQLFWTIAMRQPLMENRFAAWKFCHLLHKILREGHPNTIKNSQRHKKMILEIGKLWGHLNDGFGICVQHYTKLVVCKLDFHERNPVFPGNLVLPFQQLERISENDINVYFQLGVEMFDYMDEILALQAKIFNSVNTYRMSSMTPQGQCRLAPFIPIIQDSNQLYDFIVRLMFRLHDNLPNDILAGHRDRFRTMFNQLKTFYDSVRPLQYFADLITLPILPERAPNFTSKVDFGSYVPPVVVVPEPEPDPIVDNLVDITNMTVEEQNNFSMSSTPEPQHPQINFERLLLDRDNLIRDLQMEIDRLGKCLKSQTQQNRQQVGELEEQITKLRSQLGDVQQSLTEIRLKKNELELLVQTTPTLEQKAHAEEERAKQSEEKFDKLKSMYTQIRDEHVKLLRMHGDLNKQLNQTKKETTDLTTEKELLKVQLEEFEQKEEELIKIKSQTTESARKEIELAEKLDKITHNFDQMRIRYDDLQADKSAEIAELIIKLDNLKVEYDNLEKKSNSKITSIDADLKNRSEELSKLEESSNILLVQRDCEISELKQKLEENEQKLRTSSMKIELLAGDKLSFENDLQDSIHQQGELMQTISALESSIHDQKIRSDSAIKSLLLACIKSSEKLAIRAMNENDFSQAAGTSSYFMMIAEELQESLNELRLVYEKYTNDQSMVEGLARKTVLAGHLLATIEIQGMTICNSSADIECGERIANELKSFCKDIMSFFDKLCELPANTKNINERIQIIKDKLMKITTMIHDLSSNSDNSGQIAEQIEKELTGMDKAIEEASAKIIEMLSKSRASDSGIKLEVNEKILDSCTALMKCIRLLVQKSRFLQAEIVAAGKGTASAKEFYKRNHQWTEGLISAAKSVAMGANLLVEAANKAVSGDAKHHLNLIVAAQEISACTAQLVVASRVKAQRGSENLVKLSDASKGVTGATAVLVATAKDCSQQLETSQDLDLTKLTTHQAKTLEMEIQVKILELDQALQMERIKLATFRKKNYQNSE